MQDVLQTIKDYVNFPSGSFDLEDTTRLSQRLAKDFAALNMVVESHPGERFGPTLVCRYGEGKKPLLLMGHYDTVFPHDIAVPFEQQDNRAVGSGIVDMKGGIAVMLHALKRVLPHVDKSQHAITCVLNADEEVGSVESRAHILRCAGEAFAALSFEPSHEGSLTCERKGVTCFEVHCTGIGGHAGAAYKQSASAIQEMCRKVDALYELRDDAKDISVNIGVISGGTADNVVADSAVAKGEFRSFSPRTMQALQREVQAICEQPSLPGTKTKLVIGASHGACQQTVASHALFLRAKHIGEQMGRTLWLHRTGGAGDISFAAEKGLPVLDGLGLQGGGMHTVEEYALLDLIPGQVALAERLILDLLT